MSDAKAKIKAVPEDEKDRRAEQVARNIEIGEGITEEAILPAVMTLEEMLKRLVYIGGRGRWLTASPGGSARQMWPRPNTQRRDIGTGRH